MELSLLAGPDRRALLNLTPSTVLGSSTMSAMGHLRKLCTRSKRTSMPQRRTATRQDEQANRESLRAIHAPSRGHAGLAARGIRLV